MTTPVLEILFAHGIDESNKDEISDPSAQFSALENGRFDHLGAYEKRHGYLVASGDGNVSSAIKRLDAANASGTSIAITTRTAGRRIFPHGDEVCIIDGTYLDSYSQQLDAWVNKGRVPEVTYSLKTIPSIGIQTAVADTVVCNGCIAVAYNYFDDSGTGFYGLVSVVDAVTNAVIRPPEQINPSASTAGLDLRLATYSFYIFAVVFNRTTTSIDVWYLNTANPTLLAAGWQSLGSIATDLAIPGSVIIPINADVASCSDKIVVAYANDVGGSFRLTYKAVSTSGVGQSENVNTSGIDPVGISLSEGYSNVWLSWCEDTAAGPVHTSVYRALAFTVADLSILPATAGTIFTIVRTDHSSGMTWITATSATTAMLHVVQDSVFTGDGIDYRDIVINTGVAAGNQAHNKLYNCIIVGRPFQHGTRLYAPLMSLDNEEVVLCDVTYPDLILAWRPVAAPVMRGIFTQLTANARARVASVDGTKYVFSFNVVRAGNANFALDGDIMAEFDFGNFYPWRPAEVNKSLVLSGGVTSIYDGKRIFEANFLCRPPDATIDVSGSGAQTFVSGRSYVATYEEIDSYGNWHVSGVSHPVSSGAVTSKSVDLTIRPLSITSREERPAMPRGTGVRIGVWGTTDGNEEPYYRMTLLPNNPQLDFIQWSDTLAENQFTSSPLLYGTGNLPGTGAGQDHRAPPGLLYHVSYNGMLVGAAGSTIYFSSQPIDGEGTWFSPLFIQIIEDDVTALAVQDGTLIAFTKRGAWAVAGEPPSDNGQQGGLGTPRRLAVEFGCINAMVLTTDLGVFYQSPRGIELFTRGQTCEFIGHPIEDTVRDHPVVTAMVLDAVGDGLVRISLADSVTNGVVSATGVDVVFDIKHQLWASVDRKMGIEQASQDSAMVHFFDSNRYMWLSTDGIPYVQSTSSYKDAGAWIDMKAFTPWIHMSGLNGEQFLDQVLLLAKRFTDHDITISLAFDFVDTYTSSRTFQADSTMLREWFVKEVGQTTSQAMRVKIEDATPSVGVIDTGQGGAWTCLTINGQPHAGPKRSSSIQRGGS